MDARRRFYERRTIPKRKPGWRLARDLGFLLPRSQCRPGQTLWLAQKYKTGNGHWEFDFCLAYHSTPVVFLRLPLGLALASSFHFSDRPKPLLSGHAVPPRRDRSRHPRAGSQKNIIKDTELASDCADGRKHDSSQLFLFNFKRRHSHFRHSD